MANNPTLLKMPLATDGEKATIPETTGSTTGEFSQQYGFQAINALPLQAGGIAPKREDMNGVFNLLGGVAFYAQKGWVFAYDSTQDYYKGCIVIDPADGNKYECIADMAAGTVAPHSDTSNTYWKDANFLIKQNTPAYNHRDEITASGTYTAPVTGWYKLTLKGGGAGGMGAFIHNVTPPFCISGFGGGEGGTTYAYHYMASGTTCNVTIGAGGAGGTTIRGANDSLAGRLGGSGGNTSVTIDGTSYVANGGGAKGIGGAGTVQGAPGGSRNEYEGTGIPSRAIVGGNGGGNGGGMGRPANEEDTTTTRYGVKGGGGGGGGMDADKSNYDGAAGGDGYVWFEYWED
jgi:hypothetical protein